MKLVATGAVTLTVSSNSSLSLQKYRTLNITKDDNPGNKCEFLHFDAFYRAYDSHCHEMDGTTLSSEHKSRQTWGIYDDGGVFGIKHYFWGMYITTIRPVVGGFLHFFVGKSFTRRRIGLTSQTRNVSADLAHLKVNGSMIEAILLPSTIRIVWSSFNRSITTAEAGEAGSIRTGVQ